MNLNVFISEEELQIKIKELANTINTDYEGTEIVFITILKGAIFFATDLIRNIKTDTVLEFMQVSSYEGMENTNKLVVKKDLDSDISGKHVIVVEDIIDSGKTLSYLHEYLLSKNPASLKIAVLLDKHEKREVEVPVDYTCFKIDDKFVVGYGFDYDQKLRNLPYLGYMN